MGKKASPKKKSSTSWTHVPASEDVLYERPRHDQHYIVQVSPVTWPFLGFTQRVPATTAIFDIRSKIIAQHGGSVTDVTLYKDEVLPRNALTDLAASLSSVDFVPIHTGDAVQDSVVHICYDFPPHKGDCPLLLTPPNDLKIEAHAAAAEMKGRSRLTGTPVPGLSPTRQPRKEVKPESRFQNTKGARTSSYLQRGLPPVAS
mmetsp:Transcript_35140/g.80411  ORF Transcript_35140/g.80411 Transcript_35140/m.80411 type:complete len:202 (+) Transcript_35140:121-726(+)